jgi:hypothetical protein
MTNEILRFLQKSEIDCERTSERADLYRFQSKIYFASHNDGETETIVVSCETIIEVTKTNQFVIIFRTQEILNLIIPSIVKDCYYLPANYCLVLELKPNKEAIIIPI